MTLDTGKIVLGSNVFGWTADKGQAYEVLNAFLAAGGKMIDTADSYPHWAPGCSGGESETIIGEWVKDRGVRDQVAIATKVAHHKDFMGLKPVNVRRAAKASLERLQVEQIDLYYAHFDDPDVPVIEMAAAFSGLVDSGEIKAYGLSNFTSERIAEWCRVSHAEGLHLPVALQPHYNLVERGYETNGLRDVAMAESMKVLPYFALAKGFLTGKYRVVHDADATGASPRAKAAVEYLNDRGEAVLKALAVISERTGASFAAISLAWLRQQPSITAPIASARNASQLLGVVEAFNLVLSADDIEFLSRAAV